MNDLTTFYGPFGAELTVEYDPNYGGLFRFVANGETLLLQWSTALDLAQSIQEQVGGRSEWVEDEDTGAEA